jgi:hypothetical protein
MDKGIIYFLQPCELVGTYRYKIGCSKICNLNRCQTGYRKGTRYLCIMECINPLELERNIKNLFNKKFKIIAGNEYFEGDEKIMLKLFIEIVMKNQELSGKINIGQNTEVIEKINKIKKEKKIVKENKSLKKEIKENIKEESNKIIKFGNEKFDKIDNNKILKIIESNKDIYTEFTKLIYFNENYPEYHNVYLSDYNKEKYMTYNGETWELHDNCLNKIIDKIEELLNNKLEDNEELENLKEELYSNHEIDKKIKNLLYNNRDIVINNYKKINRHII